MPNSPQQYQIGLEAEGMLRERNGNLSHGMFTTSFARVSEYILRAVLLKSGFSNHLDLFGVSPLNLRPDEKESFADGRAHYHRLRTHSNAPILRNILIKHLRPWLLHSHYPALVRKLGLDLMVYTNPSIWGEIAVARREVVTTYDYYPERLNKSARERTQRQIDARKGNLWISAISDFTAQDAMELFGLPKDRVRSIPLAVDHDVYNAVENSSDCIPRPWDRYKDYVLFIGNFTDRKNIWPLAQAMEAINCERKEPVAFVAAGNLTGARWRNRMELRRRFHALFQKTPYFELLHPTNEEVAALYRGASILGHPATFEGFGFTVLEAMACGCPVACGNHSSLSEVTGGAARYVPDVHRVSDWTAALTDIMDKPNLKKRLIDEGMLQAQRFQWSRFESETMALYHEILKS